MIRWLSRRANIRRRYRMLRLELRYGADFAEAWRRWERRG